MGRRNPIILYLPLLLFSLFPFLSQLHAAPSSGPPLIKQLSSILKWTKSSSPKSAQSDGNVIQFENGYLVETVVEGNALGVVPYSIRVSQDGELFAVDAHNSNIVRITPPLSQYSRARLVAGSFQGKTGHVDGKSNDARFNHPRGAAMDDKGNVYVADTDNLAIRKIGEGGVTTIAGGKSNIPGYRDGPSEDAKFSTDFDVVYVPSTCSLLVVDRGNAALRQILLNVKDCEDDNSSISMSDVLMVIGAVFVGYATCLIHQGVGRSSFSKLLQSANVQEPEKEKQSTILESVKEEHVTGPGWPSVGQLISDKSKLALELLNNSCAAFIPSRFTRESPRKGLTPLKDTLKMPEDEVNPQLTEKKQRAPPPRSESWQVYPPNTMDKYSEAKISTSKLRSSSLKDPTLSSRHRSSKRQEFAEFYGTSEALPQQNTQMRSKSQKERSKHRHREKSGEVASMANQGEPNSGEFKAVNYGNPKFDPYNNMGSRYMPDGSYRF